MKGCESEAFTSTLLHGSSWKVAVIAFLCSFESTMKPSSVSFGKILNKTFSVLGGSNPLILASSTAFFATFSLSPIIVILVNILSLYFKSETISRQLFVNLEATFGKQVVKQIELIVHNFMSIKSNMWVTAGGFVFLFFVATTLMMVVQQSIHVMWHIIHKPNTRVKTNFIERAKAVGFILCLGLLFLASQVLDATILLLKDYLKGFAPMFYFVLLHVVNISLSIVLNTAWFTALFKFLPDARVAWRVAIAGGLVTGMLFNLGKVLLGKVLVYSNVVTVFGASASIALLLLFIFYSSLIMYFGAAFTFAYGLATKRPIRPNEYANLYEEKVVASLNTEL